MYSHIKRSLDQISRRLKGLYPSRIVSIYAFGSRVRGEHKEWSDIDLLIIVKHRDPAIERDIVGLIVDEEEKSGLSFSPVIKDYESFMAEKRLQTPFYKNIERDGIALL